MNMYELDKRLQNYSNWCNEQVKKYEPGTNEHTYWLGRWHSAEDIAMVAYEAKDFLESEML